MDDEHELRRDDRSREAGDGNGWKRDEGDRGVVGGELVERDDRRETAGGLSPSPTRSSELTESGGRGGGLTPAEFYALQRVPPEAEWFANLRNKNTRRAYRNDVGEFMAFAGLNSPQEFRLVNRAAVIAWRGDLERRVNPRGEPLAAATIRRKLAAVASLFDYLLEHNAVLINPADGVKRPAAETGGGGGGGGEGKTPTVSDRQAKRLLDAPARDTTKGIRDRAILSVLLHHGLRRDELVKLRVGDVQQRRGFWTLRVRGKGGKLRHVELHPSTHERISLYLEAAGHGEDRRGALFRPVVNRTGSQSLERPLNSGSVWRLCKKYALLAGIDPSAFTTHSCRATAATNALEHDAPIEAVQTWLGHSDISTTRLYARRRGGGEDSPTFRVAY